MNLNPDRSDTERLFGFMDDIIPMMSAHNTGLRSCNVKTGKIDFANNFFNLLGLDAIGVEYSNLEESRACIHIDDLALFDAAFSEVCASSAGHASVIYRHVGSKGETVRLKDNLYAAASSGGKHENILIYTVNAQLQVSQQDKIDELEDKYRKLINTLPDFIFVFDDKFIFQDIIMPEGMSLLHTREELIGTSGRKIFTEEVSDLYQNNILDCLKTGQMKEIEYYLMIKDVKYYFQARIVPFEDNKVFALIRDIGDRVRRMGELLEARRLAENANKMKSAFLANMSHEIRTPLNAIVGFTEIIAAEEDPTVRDGYMDIVRTNSDLLLQLINDILDLSRIESGKCDINFQKTEINTLVRDVAKTHEFKIREGVDLKIVQPDGELWVLTDHNRVIQVLFNFLSNAIKNTDLGSITIGVEVLDEHLRLSVTDTGRGIPADKLKFVFNRFEKLDSLVQGTGLGLAISESLIERLGGEIGVSSEFGKGSRFWFTIPFRPDAYVSLASYGSCAEPDDPAQPKRKKILVAEDSRENFNFINEVLKRAYDVDVLWAKNGEEVVNMFIMENPALILMNIQLPVMSGIDAAKKIRSVSSCIPIIAITANAFYMEQQLALESGCNDIISKPYSETKLEEIVLAYM